MATRASDGDHFLHESVVTQQPRRPQKFNLHNGDLSVLRKQTHRRAAVGSVSARPRWISCTSSMDTLSVALYALQSRFPASRLTLNCAMNVAALFSGGSVSGLSRWSELVVVVVSSLLRPSPLFWTRIVSLRQGRRS